jgi:protein O-GlcNAc transferase
MVTQSLDDYEILAMRLANKAEKLYVTRQRLVKNRLTAPLFDTLRFVRNLEKVFKQMWGIYFSGDSPRPITVKEKYPHVP